MSKLWDISQGYSSRAYNNIINAFDEGSKIKKNKSTAFHYTSFSNCINMLKAPSTDDYYLELFASHFRYMNDTREFLQGLDYINETLNILNGLKDEEILQTIESFKKHFMDGNIPYYAVPPHYIVSFNTNCNNLAQWKYYGKNCGVAIEYDLNNCVFSNYSIAENYVPHNSYYVNYNKREQQEEINNILQKLIELDNSELQKNKKVLK